MRTRNPFETPLEDNGESAKERREEIRAAVNSEIAAEMLRLHEGEPFHNERHPENVGADAKDVLDFFSRYTAAVTPEDYLATETGSEGHDLIINYSIETDPKAFNFGQRVRHRGFGDHMPPTVRSRPEVAEIDGKKKGNEELSWLRIQEIVKKHDPNGEVYTPLVMEKIGALTAATYPDAGPFVVPENYMSLRDEKTGETVNLAGYLGKNKDGEATLFLFDQPLLGPESDVSVIAGAFGDLMYGGRHSAGRFRDHGNEEYREINEVVSATVKKEMSPALQAVAYKLPKSTLEEIAGGVEKLSPERKAEIAKSAINWVASQVGFLLGQKIRFESLMQSLRVIQESRDPEGLRQGLKDDLYKNFDQNIIETARRADRVREVFSDLTNAETFSASPDAAERFEKLLQEEMGYFIAK